ncbi:MAG: threonine ammonia-lyase [Rhodospirillaceae bacterium]|nr:threonine ammonia-lyase [Rhodospirillaceae bacterium]MBT3492189.1 threonine ammonia-lyase [Rhodospirillaceae bacterium]MBT3778560.1 threonine ammonia-lyase [Rhodospirillaceae bacterium]MBT3977534.1 threonine ammonia-lyase [Rhodospirillaceae bacterium]MBT4169147.1 threonine ammonia-lyase [Rhodospirillaceae bacterium]
MRKRLAMQKVSYEDIRRAQAQMAGFVVETPCANSLTLSRITGAEVFLKFENLQFTGSFKDRGALIKLLQLDEAARAKGVIANSAGNHAQGVAYHAQRLGIPATIVMPVGTPNVKVRQTRELGADVVLQGETVDEAALSAEAIRDQRQLTYIHPYNDAAIIAGQGTVALEMLAAAPQIDTLVVPIGGGGLIAGNAIAARAINPEIEIIGVESQLYPSAYQARHGLANDCGGQTIAEGIAVAQPGSLTLPVIDDLVSDILLLSEQDIERAIDLLITVEKTVTEGAGAAGLAALLAYPERFRGRVVGLILCGGNIDTRMLSSILMRGLIREGRITRMRVEISDRPGALAKVAQLVGEAGGNILEVQHQRNFPGVPAKLAELDLVLETRDRDHIHELTSALRAAGYKVRELIDTPDAG